MMIHSHKIITDNNFFIALLHAATITESPSQDKLLLIRQFFAWLTGPLPSKCTLTFAHSFAKLSRKYPNYLQTPAISTGGIKGKANTRGLGVWLSQSLTCESLVGAFGPCFLRLQKATLGSTSGRCKDVLQDHGISLWRSRGKASPSEAWLLWCGTILLLDPAAGGGSP